MDGNRVVGATATYGQSHICGRHGRAGCYFLVRNAERFEDFQTESRYSELIEMVEPIQDMIEEDLLSGRWRHRIFR